MTLGAGNHEDNLPTTPPDPCPECNGVGFKYTACQKCGKLYSELLDPKDFPHELSNEEKAELIFIARIAAPIYAEALAPMVVKLLEPLVKKALVDIIRQERVTPVDGIDPYDIDHG